MVGKWHLCPTVEMNLASTRRNWPTGPGLRALLRVPRRRDEPVVPGPGLRQPPGRPAAHAGGGLPLHRGHHRQGARVHQGRQGARAREAVLPLLRAGRLPRARTTRRRSGSTATRAASTWATRRCASRRSPARRSWASSRPTPSCRRSTRSARPRPAPGPDGKPFPALDVHAAVGLAVGRREAAVLPGWPRSTPASWRTPTHQIGRLLDYLEETGPAREHARHPRLRQRRERRGRPERLGQREEVLQRHPRRHRGEPRDARRARRPEDLQPLPQRLGDGVQHAVQDVEALRVQRRHVATRASSRGRPGSGAGARSASSTTTRSTSCRRSSTCSASSRRRRSRATCRATSTA